MTTPLFLDADAVAALSDDDVIALTNRGQWGPGVVGGPLFDRVQQIILAGGIPEIETTPNYKKGLPPGATKGHAAARVGKSRDPRRKRR